MAPKKQCRCGRGSQCYAKKQKQEVGDPKAGRSEWQEEESKAARGEASEPLEHDECSHGLLREEAEREKEKDAMEVLKERRRGECYC